MKRACIAGLNISGPALSISGGVILFLIAIRMIFPSKPESEDSGGDGEPVIVPLAVQMLLSGLREFLAGV